LRDWNAATLESSSRLNRSKADNYIPIPDIPIFAVPLPFDIVLAVNSGPDSNKPAHPEEEVR